MLKTRLDARTRVQRTHTPRALTTPLQAVAVLDVVELLDVLDQNVVRVEKLDDLEDVLLEAVTVI